MENKHYRDELSSLLIKQFVPAGYKITKDVQLGPVPESAKYDALCFALDGRTIVYRKGKVTPDRPGAFLAVWQRPSTVSHSQIESTNSNKPIPFNTAELDYLFVSVVSHCDDAHARETVQGVKSGLFIFPVAVLIEKGIVSSVKTKGKTGFRVFPPWSENRGVIGTQLFSAAGKKTQRWQLPYFLSIDDNGVIEAEKLNLILSHNHC